MTTGILAMNADSPQHPDSTTYRLSSLRRIVSLCERYEAAGLAGNPPRIEEMLEEVPRSDWPELLRLIVAQDIQIRRERGEEPNSRDYQARFPEWSSTIEEVFQWEEASRTGRPEAPASQATVGDTVGLAGSEACAVGSEDRRDDPANRGSEEYWGEAVHRPRFVPLRELDRGGLGVILLAEDRELNREVAVKEIQRGKDHDPDARDRFVREAMITAQLEHPGVVAVYSLGYHFDGRPYYAMRLIRTTDSGGPAVTERLEDQISRFHELPRGDSTRELELRRLLRNFHQVCLTIEYAHSRRVIHRDIKPKNILLGPFGEVLVVDWGIARIMGESDATTEVSGSGAHSPPRLPEQLPTTVTRSGDVLGTLAYMPPEQAAGETERLDRVSDVYSLGATLYVILTGRPPFRSQGKDGETLRREVIQGKFPPPRQLDAKIPRGLEAVCLKAMSMEPADRYRSARALAEDVERWLNDSPVLAWPEPMGVRIRRVVRRHGTLAATVALVLLATTFGLAVSTLLITQQQAQTRRALDIARDEGRRAERERIKAEEERHCAGASRSVRTSNARGRSRLGRGASGRSSRCLISRPQNWGTTRGPRVSAGKWPIRSHRSTSRFVAICPTIVSSRSTTSRPSARLATSSA